MSDVVLANSRAQLYGRHARDRVDAWERTYLIRVGVADLFCAVVAVAAALEVRFDGHVTRLYAAISLVFPALWVIALLVAGGYDTRFIGTGQDEFRKVADVGVTLTALLAIASYAVNEELSREYLLITMPTVTALDLLGRCALRKRLHAMRASGRCMNSVVAVGHAGSVSDLITELRRERRHGLAVVAACVTGPAGSVELAGVPVLGDVNCVPAVVRQVRAETVAVLACPEIDGLKLRELAWELEKTGTNLCVAPALLDVAGPRTTVRPAAGLTLLHVDHARLGGMRRLLKGLFDRSAAALALAALAPMLVLIGLAIRVSDHGPALFTQVRIGKDGRTFRIYKFRTMVTDAEKRKSHLMPSNDLDGLMFKLRRDPRVTAIGAHLRRWSMDELPQLLNVVLGDMSLVGPRPALPDEAERYPHHVRRRLVVKPGLTGLWQVNGRSDLSWEESVRLDIRYVENWSLTLDLQILWRTVAAISRGSGAY